MRFKDRKLLIVCAPAGFGKTTLVLDFAAELAAPVCWNALGPSDSDPVFFLTNLIRSLRTHFPGLGQNAESRIAAANDTGKESRDVIATLVADIRNDVPGTIYILLDDYHYIEGSEAVSSLVSTLIESIPDNCHLILTSRSMPKLATLPRLLLSREVAALGTGDLQFTPDEITELFLQTYGVNLDKKQAEELAADSGGWISGIILTTPALWQGLLRQTVAQKGPGGALFEYLSQEVYSQLPEESRRFLLAVSVLSELEPGFCNELLVINNSLPLLEDIERRNLFVSRLEAASPLFRFHQLFQDFLRARFKEDEGQRYLDLNVKAADLYERAGNSEESVRLYCLAHRWTDCTRVVKGCGEKMAQAGRWQTLRKWIEGLPEDIQDSSPDLLLWRAQAAIRSGDTNLAVRLCNQAMEQPQERLGGSGVVRALLCRGSALRMLGQPAACGVDARRALTLLRSQPQELGLTADARRQLGSVYGQQGDFPRAQRELEKALALYMKAGQLAEISRVHDQLGIACSQLAQLDKAALHFDQAKQGWLSLSNWSELARTLNNSGEFYRLKGEPALALVELESSLKNARRSGNSRAEAWALKSVGDVRLDGDEFESAIAQYTASLDLARKAFDDFLVARCTLAIGDCYRLMGRNDKAGILIDQAICQAEERKNGYELSLCLLVQGQMKSTQGEHQKAMASLRKSAKLLEQSGNKREMARVCFYLARARFDAGDRAGASRYLNSLTSLLGELGHFGFLLADARRATELIEYSGSTTPRGKVFDDLLSKLRGGTAITGIVSVEKRVDAYAFGPSKVAIDGHDVRDIEWRSKKSKELFFYLLSHRQGATKEQIFEMLWPEWSPERCNNLFHPTTHRLRQALYHDCLKIEDGRYVLQAGDLHYDVEEFQRFVSEAGRLPKGSEDKMSRLHHAVSLYKGTFLEDFYSEWCGTLRQDLERQYVSALASLAGYYAAKGQHSNAVELMEKCLAIDKFQEDAQYELMNLHLKAGNFSGASWCYQQYSNLLHDELGVEPPQRMKDLLSSAAARG